MVAIYSGVQRLFVVDVALEKEKDNPQLIFESMNSTGLDLSQADLIRNYVLMGQEVHLQTSLYESYWYPMEQGYGSEYAALFNSFMRDYFISEDRYHSSYRYGVRCFQGLCDRGKSSRYYQRSSQRHLYLFRILRQHGSSQRAG